MRCTIPRTFRLSQNFSGDVRLCACRQKKILYCALQNPYPRLAKGCDARVGCKEGVQVAHRRAPVCLPALCTSASNTRAAPILPALVVPFRPPGHAQLPP